MSDNLLGRRARRTELMKDLNDAVKIGERFTVFELSSKLECDTRELSGIVKHLNQMGALRKSGRISVHYENSKTTKVTAWVKTIELNFNQGYARVGKSTPNCYDRKGGEIW